MTRRPAPDAHPVRGRLRRRALAVVVAPVLVALSACVGMPTSGPVEVGVGVDGVSEAGPGVVPLADLPGQDAGPEAIVVGFLKASQAGFSRDPRTGGDFTAAREYLSGEARSTWKPRERVVVYPTTSGPTFTVVDDTQVQVSLRVAARIDADGRYAEAAPDAEESLVFDLVQDSSDQWRIAGLEDGVVLDESNFENLFRSATLYFVARPDDKFLVPETRWFPARNIATSIVRELLDGPSPWLRDAVRSAIPEGVQLTPDAVPVDATNSTASVGLTPAALTDPEERALMLAQIEASLAIPSVRSVVVTAGELPLDVVAAEPARGVDADAVLEVISPDGLAKVVQGELEPLDVAGTAAELGVRDAARNESGSVRVLISGQGDLVRAATDGEPAATLLSGPGLLAPSVDRFGWAWSGFPGPSGALVAVRADGQQAPVTASWLEGRSVTALRVARDGSRVAVLSTGTDGLAVDVAAVVRDPSGSPLQLGEPLGTGAALVDARDVVWVDDSTLGVLGRSGVATSASYHLVPVAGQTVSKPALDGAVAIAGGKGVRSLYVASADGRLFWLPGASWVEVASDVRDPYYPG